MHDTTMIRFCPSCETERALDEMFCEGQMPDGHHCGWSLVEVPIRPQGWRPAVVVPADAEHSQEVTVEHITPVDAGPVCTNGHPMEAGDLMCAQCGADLAETPVPAPAAEGDDVEAEAQAAETVIDGWRVLHPISSAVGLRDRYLAEEVDGERRAVLTLYHQGAEPDPSVYEALQRVPAVHVPQFYAIGRWNERAYEVAEELTGGTLADLGLVAGDTASVRKIVYELGMALQALAEVGLRHRDLRPGTLLVRNRDPLDLVIGGFGSARLSEFDLDIVSPLEITCYTAPEAVAGGVAAASDWWSLGMVLLEQITRGECFAGVNQHAFLIHVLANGAPIPDGLDASMELLLRGLLARDRMQRWGWAQVKDWLDGKAVAAPARAQAAGQGGAGPAITLAGESHHSLAAYALAAAEAPHWEAAREQLLRGALTTWVQEAEAPAQVLAALRRIAQLEMGDDFKLLLALKVLNSEMPPIHTGAIVTPRWLLEHPLEAYELITGPVPDVLDELGTESWLGQLKTRVGAVRNRARNLDIALDEDTLRINLLSTSRVRLAAEWEERRKLLPDTEHLGLLNLLERRSLSEEDLIVVLSAEIGQFRACELIVQEARSLALQHGVHQFLEAAARETIRWPRSEILQAVAERIEGFARCASETVNGWADTFRIDKRIPLAQALVLLAIPQAQWQVPQKQQYIAQILDFFEKKIVTSVMRGPLVRMAIGRTTGRVDLTEFSTPRLDAGALLDHIVQRNGRAIALDPAVFDPTDSTIAMRLSVLERNTLLHKRDTGIDGCYLGFPFLLTRDARPGAATRIAPALLWPVKLSHTVGARGKVTLAFDGEREEVRINPALEGLVGPEAEGRWRKAVDALLGRSALRAADVMDALGTLALPRSRALVALPGTRTPLDPHSTELECAAVLFHVTFSGQAIGEDIRQLKSLPAAGTGLETALRLGPQVTAESMPRPPEVERYFTVHSDPSQEDAVLRARTAPGLVVEGPPGTGKSQTIVNMVGDAIGSGRSLLIVCQKHAALEVVHKRLVAEGLGHRVVMVNDVNRDRMPVIRSVREQLEALLRRKDDPAAPIRRSRQELAARVEALERTLDSHHEALHRMDERIGSSYRVLLGELIQLEAGTPPLDVPALRPTLEPLNLAELAALEEELAPLARYWLPARYEDSALVALRAFTADAATVTDFTEALQALGAAEDARMQVLLSSQASFDLDDPAPHRAWLAAHGPLFLELAEDDRVQLARWLPLFRAQQGGEAEGAALIAELLRLRDALAACRLEDVDAKLSPAVARMGVSQLQTLEKLVREALTPAGWLARLSPLRYLRGRRLVALLQGLGEAGGSAGLPVVRACTALEQQLRPLRAALQPVLQRLQLPPLAEDAGAEMVAATAQTLAALQRAAQRAELLASAPAVGKMDRAAQAGSREAIVHLYAEYDAVFARCDVRERSRAALARLAQWMEPAWVEACAQAMTSHAACAQQWQPLCAALPTLAAYQYFRARAERLSPVALQALRQLRGKQDVLDAMAPSTLEEAVRRILRREARLGWKRSMELASPELVLEREELEAKVAHLAELDRQLRGLNRALLRESYDLAAIRPLREWEDVTRLTGQRARRLREFLDLGGPLGLMKLRPVWLMNPDVASRVLPLKSALFDTVIYDEASQMPVEFALPSLFRARVSVVSGDEKQMPPTAFFSSKVESDEAQSFDGEGPEEDASEEEREAYDETWNRREIKDCPDLLQLARTSLPNARLQIHYRSAYRELINYSNAAFYGNDLHVPVRHSPSAVAAARPIEMIRVDGVYQEQTNPAEAKRVVDLLAEIWRAPYAQRPSVGVVTFNRKQADLIEDTMEARAEADESFREAYRLELQRNEDGEDMGVFVKNVENVQGDERDVIVFSSTFGRNPQGTFRRNFGVLGQKGGERRLNVAVTRSRCKIYMVTSMPINDISDALTTRRPLSSPRDFLQGYMAYARTVSSADLDGAKALLGRWASPSSQAAVVDMSAVGDGFRSAVGAYIRGLGHAATTTAEGDAFGLDYAIEHPQTGIFAIGIECDAPRHDLLEHARAREVWRRNVLQRAVPVIHRVSSQAWFQDGAAERERLRTAIAQALAVLPEAIPEPAVIDTERSEVLP
ncbi:AAA domain-containing protein [Comamonas sp. GB3 AK4-5]|uniref:AAA domain-containing protein n=1 Tax=Comamonas sp. GB3 AK4-5 TaxID=3231487 RepID=UPI00351ECFE2